MKVFYLNGKIQTLAGQLYDLPETANSSPSISEKQALKTALDHINAQKYIWNNESDSNYPSGELVFVRKDKEQEDEKEEIVLAFKFDIYAEIPLSREYIYVDAHRGVVVHENAIIKHAIGQALTRYSGTQTIETTFVPASNHYILRDATRGSGIETYNLKSAFRMPQL